jgi:tricorn protease-like protein
LQLTYPDGYGESIIFAASDTLWNVYQHVRVLSVNFYSSQIFYLPF